MPIHIQPEGPKPPTHLIDAAERAIPEVLDEEQVLETQRSISFSLLARLLQEKSHTPSAAQWAIHGMLERGLLTTVTAASEPDKRVGRTFRSGPWPLHRTSREPVNVIPLEKREVSSTAELLAYWKGLPPPAPAPGVRAGKTI